MELSYVPLGDIRKLMDRLYEFNGDACFQVTAVTLTNDDGDTVGHIEFNVDLDEFVFTPKG